MLHSGLRLHNWKLRLHNWLKSHSFADARYDQILFLSLFLGLGIGTRDWTLQPGYVALALGTCLLTQLIFTIGLTINQHWHAPHPEQGFGLHIWYTWQQQLPSALITGLGLSLLLRCQHPQTMILAACLAITSKFILRYHQKHLFNPANFGIIATLLLSQDAWVSPGQWGDEARYGMLFLAAGGLVLQKVGRWDTSVAFLVSYAGLEALRNFWLGWGPDVLLHRLSSGSLWLFALFMLTDPRTIPNSRAGRLVWALAIAVLTFGLRNIFFNADALFWALFALSPTSWLIDRYWPAPRFRWQPAPTLAV
jgi:Na+-transporting NADH:ubiquinone oxidoreductase subunit NqrB